MTTEPAAPAVPFRVRERVRWADVDLVGIMRYSAYTRFLDVAEAELLRAIALPVPVLRDDHGVWLPRRVLHVEYHAPAAFDAELEVRLWVTAIGTSSLTLAGEVWSADGATRHATISVVLVAVDVGTLAKRPLPDAVARAFAAYRLE